MARTLSKQYAFDTQSTDRLLKVVIGLLVKQKEDNSTSLKRQIEILNSLGMRPVEIAESLGRTASYVNKELSGLRKNRKQHHG